MLVCGLTTEMTASITRVRTSYQTIFYSYSTLNGRCPYFLAYFLAVPIFCRPNSDTLFGHIPSWFPLIGGFAVGPLPIAMGITMVIQQKMTPSSADPAQQKMMMLMPIIFTFMFLNFASGLVLYWLVNNILSIAQQFHVNRKLAKEKA